MASEKSIRVRVVEWARHDELVGSLVQTVCMNEWQPLSALFATICQICSVPLL